MRIRLMAVASGVAVPLILADPAVGGFVGTFAEVKLNEFGLATFNIYACFDRPGEDYMHAVFASAGAPLSVEVLNGTFFQHEFGTDRPPHPGIIEFFPELRYDTFVTIGVKSFNPQDPGQPEGQPSDDMFMCAGWPGFGPSTLESDSLCWAVTPIDPQGDPFNPDFVAGNGCVLLGQFTLEPLVPGGQPGLLVTMPVQVVSNGVTEVDLVQFAFLGCLGGECDDDGDPCNGVEQCAGPECENGVPCAAGCISVPTPDCNSNGTLDSCDIADGTSDDLNGNGVPDECDPPCPWDCAGDGDLHVTIVDFLALLAQWNTFGACDFDGGGVRVTDFLELLDNWGPCP